MVQNSHNKVDILYGRPLIKFGAHLRDQIGRLSSFRDLTKEIRGLSNVEQVLLDTADSVMDTKRKVEFGVQQIIFKVGAHHASYQRAILGKQSSDGRRLGLFLPLCLMEGDRLPKSTLLYDAWFVYGRREQQIRMRHLNKVSSPGGDASLTQYLVSPQPSGKCHPSSRLT